MPPVDPTSHLTDDFNPSPVETATCSPHKKRHHVIWPIVGIGAIIVLVALIGYVRATTDPDALKPGDPTSPAGKAPLTTLQPTTPAPTPASTPTEASTTTSLKCTDNKLHLIVPPLAPIKLYTHSGDRWVAIECTTEKLNANQVLEDRIKDLERQVKDLTERLEKSRLRGK